MLRFSKTAGYAILALSFLDQKKENWILESQLADVTGISKPYLSKLVNILKKFGYVKGKRGYKGGVALSKPATEIKVSEVIDVIDGKGWYDFCILNLPHCPDRCQCPLHQFWVKERKKIYKKLDSMSIRQFRQSRYKKNLTQSNDHPWFKD